MADGRHCVNCGFTETDHMIVRTRRFAARRLSAEEKRAVDAAIQKKYPGICYGFRNGRPKPKRR